MKWVKLGKDRVNLESLACVTESVGNEDGGPNRYVVLVRFIDGSHREFPADQCRKLLEFVDAQAYDFSTRAY